MGDDYRCCGFELPPPHGTEPMPAKYVVELFLGVPATLSVDDLQPGNRKVANGVSPVTSPTSIETARVMISP